MIRVVLFSPIAEETSRIRLLLTAYSIQHSWADCQVEIISRRSDLETLENTADIFISDVSDPDVVALIKTHKTVYPPMRVFPIADASIPPTAYVCPEIMPCGLFWRPVSQQSALAVVEQMMSLVHDQQVPISQNSFRIAGKQKVQEVPYNAILYFEAREKKLALRMQTQELMFAGTLGKLEEALPQEFIRCHKSFIVNRQHILSVDRTNGNVILDNRMELPISRSYRKSFWGVYQDEI